MEIQLAAIPDERHIQKLSLMGIEPSNFRKTIASLVADTTRKSVLYRMASWIPLEEIEVTVHGFVPRGWRSDALTTLPVSPAAPNGAWNYSEAQEKNILAGLAYLLVRSSKNRQLVIRAQIEPQHKTEPKLEDFVTVTGLAGNCGSSLTIDGVLDNVPMEMAPAQVMIARSGAKRNAQGKMEQTIGCAVRVGDARVPGVGRVEIQMFGENNPGTVESITEENDFPAKMTLDVHKRYVTPFGNFYTDTEQFEAENIPRFPPFGVKFKPIVQDAPLREEATNRQVGHIRLGWLVPLFYLDRSDFPSKLPLLLAEGEEE